MSHGQYKLTNRPSVVILLIYMWVILFILIILLSVLRRGEGDNEYTLAVVVIGIGFFIVNVFRVMLVGRIIKRRQQKLLDTQIALGQSGENHSVSFGYSSLTELGKGDGTIVKNRAFTNFIRGNDYNYADYSYGVFHRTKHGDMLVRTHYYSVICTNLPRKMPHVLFDSLIARKRQFRFIYSAHQLQVLEGDFNKYFVVYFPQSYHIDSLSFVTPDVMWAMKEAADYDIEIVGDKLFLFGHQSDPETQILDMAAKLAAIKKTLVRSVSAYRDDRLPYAAGKQSVAPIGVYLAKSLTKAYIWLAISVVSLGIGLYIATLVGSIFNHFAILGAFGIAINYQNINKELQHRKKIQKLTIEQTLAEQ